MTERVSNFVLVLAGVVAVLIIAAAAVALTLEPTTFTARQAQFEFVVTQTLLPMFTLIAAASAAYLVLTAAAKSLRGS